MLFTNVHYKMTGTCVQYSGVTLPVGAPLPKKAPPCWRPLPFWCPSLKLNKLGDFREYAGKISKKVCI